MIEHLILKEGSPLVIVSDLGSEFVSEVFRELLEMLNIEKRETSPFHPAANGLIERYFSTFSNMMATLVETNQNRWENLLPFVVSAYNHTVHTATGFTPAYLFTGRDHILPFEQIYPISLPRSYNENKSVAEQTSEFLASAWSLARDNIAAAQASYKFYHDKLVNGSKIKVGDTVYISVPITKVGNVRKFSMTHKGPYIIVSLYNNGLNAVVRALGDDGRQKGIEFVVNLERVKAARSPVVPHTSPTYVSKKRVKTQVPNPAKDRPSDTPVRNDPGTTAVTPSDSTPAPLSTPRYNLRPRN